MTIGSEYSSGKQTDKISISTTIETDPEPQSVSINPDVTPTYEFGTTNSTLILENSIFLFQIGTLDIDICIVYFKVISYHLVFLKMLFIMHNFEDHFFHDNRFTNK